MFSTLYSTDSFYQSIPLENQNLDIPEISDITHYSKGFYPIIGKIVAYHTNDSNKAYEWQKKHPLRQVALSIFQFRYSLSEFLKMPFIQTVCTVTAYNVFSVFVESSIPDRDPNFAHHLLQQEQYGVPSFKKQIERVKSFGSNVGMACFCYVGSLHERMHEFVVELTPGGNLYLYQSYFGRYTLNQGLQKAGPWKMNELLEKIALLELTSTSACVDERLMAYEELFFVKMKKLRKLHFAFTPFEYNLKAIPSLDVGINGRNPESRSQNSEVRIQKSEFRILNSGF